MMSSNAIVEIAHDFLKVKKLFEEIGFELIGTKYIKEDKVFIAKEKKK